jgi:hypothetical protein
MPLQVYHWKVADASSYDWTLDWDDDEGEFAPPSNDAATPAKSGANVPQSMHQHLSQHLPQHHLQYLPQHFLQHLPQRLLLLTVSDQTSGQSKILEARTRVSRETEFLRRSCYDSNALNQQKNILPLAI